jgi:hypothetical protein
MIVWVDNIITVANNIAEIDHAEAEMKSKYTVKVIGEPTMLLGIHITRNHAEQMIRLSQVTTFGMENANPASTPMDPNVVLRENEELGGDSHASQAYVTAIGKLLYAAHATHPNILYAVVTLANFTKNPSVAPIVAPHFRICRVALVGPTLLTSLYKSITDFSYFFQLPMSSAMPLEAV